MNDDGTDQNEDPMKRLLLFLFSTFTAIVGFQIHGSVFWAIVDFIFSPLAWLKWLICQEVSISVIREAFSFFLK